VRKNNNYNNSEFTIEHVLPDSDAEETAQIGNLILLEQQLNEKCANKTLSEKLDIYLSSNFLTTRNFANRYKQNEFKPSDRTKYLASLFYNDILNLNKPNISTDIEKQLAFTLKDEKI